MVPAHAAAQFQAVGILIVGVQTHHLRSLQAVAPATAEASAAATAAEAHVADVVGLGEAHQPHRAVEAGSHQAARIALLGAQSGVDVGEGAAVHAALQSEVEHHLLLAVVDARDAGLVALLVVGLHALHNRCGQVLDGRLRVAGHELLAVDLNLLHLLADDGDGAVIADLGTRQFLHQLLDDGAFWRLVGAGVINQGILLRIDLRQVLHHLDVLEHLRVDLHGQRAQIDRPSADGYRLEECLISNVGDAQDVGAVLLGRHRELSAEICLSIGDERAVVLEQCDCRSDDGFLLVGIDHRAAHRPLCLR